MDKKDKVALIQLEAERLEKKYNLILASIKQHRKKSFWSSGERTAQMSALTKTFAKFKDQLINLQKALKDKIFDKDKSLEATKKRSDELIFSLIRNTDNHIEAINERHINSASVLEKNMERYFINYYNDLQGFLKFLRKTLKEKGI